jgi:hypothetical protein
MALIVETGSASTTAESYASVADADTYHANRANTDWASLATAAKEAALRKATDYMTQQYGERWKGYRYTNTQALDWPRSWVLKPGPFIENFYEHDEIPAPVSRACMELALRASAGDLSEDTAQEIIREKVGQIETEYQPGSRAGAKYPAVERGLAPLLTGSGGVQIAKA